MKAKRFFSSVINLKQLIELTGWSKHHIYKLTSNGTIPHYKPFGKTLFFSREEVEDWLLQNKIKSNDEINSEANDYLLTNKKEAL